MNKQKALESLVIYRRGRSRAIGGDFNSGFDADLLHSYIKTKELEAMSQYTGQLITDLYTNQLKMKKAELEVLLDAAKNPLISKEVKLGLLRRALDLYESVKDVG
jgi:hypothetical protein